MEHDPMARTSTRRLQLMAVLRFSVIGFVVGTAIGYVNFLIIDAQPQTTIGWGMISGFMIGIGCIIIILQLAPLIGHPTPGSGTLAALAGLPELIGSPKLDAAVVGLLALGIVYLTPARIGRFVPAPLIALSVGTVLVLAVFPGVPVLGEIPTGLPEPHLPTFTLEAVPAIVQSALVLALLAIVLGLGGLAQQIPHAVLAGILIKVGIDIIDWSYLRRLREAPRAGVFSCSWCYSSPCSSTSSRP